MCFSFAGDPPEDHQFSDIFRLKSINVLIQMLCVFLLPCPRRKSAQYIVVILNCLYRIEIMSSIIFRSSYQL